MNVYMSMCVPGAHGDLGRCWFPGTPVTDGCEVPYGQSGLEPGSSVRVLSALNCWVISLAPLPVHYLFMRDDCSVSSWEDKFCPLNPEMHSDAPWWGSSVFSCSYELFCALQSSAISSWTGTKGGRRLTQQTPRNPSCVHLSNFVWLWGFPHPGRWVVPNYFVAGKNRDFGAMMSSGMSGLIRLHVGSLPEVTVTFQAYQRDGVFWVPYLWYLKFLQNFIFKPLPSQQRGTLNAGIGLCCFFFCG